MGFTKLDEGILQSSIMAEDPNTFKVWIALLASCREDGVAKISSVFLASICRMEQEKVEKALEILSSPDKNSRTMTHEGRRIRRIDGGFELLNYHRYRERSFSDSTNATRQRRFRAKKALHGVTCNDVTESNGDISASASSSGIQEGMQGESLSALPPAFIAFWTAYPRKVGKTAALRAWMKLKEPAATLELIVKALGWQKMMDGWTKENGQYIPHPATYLNQGRWMDEPPPHPLSAPKKPFNAKDQPPAYRAMYE